MLEYCSKIPVSKELVFMGFLCSTGTGTRTLLETFNLLVTKQSECEYRHAGSTCSIIYHSGGSHVPKPEPMAKSKFVPVFIPWFLVSESDIQEDHWSQVTGICERDEWRRGARHSGLARGARRAACTAAGVHGRLPSGASGFASLPSIL